MCAAATKSESATKTKEPRPNPRSPDRPRRLRPAAAMRRKVADQRPMRGRQSHGSMRLKHGMTAQSILLPGDDGQAFASRLRYLLDDLQPRNSLEAVVIERLAGDLWKSDRAEGSACGRISFRLRHEPVDQALNDRHEAIELGQHLLWQPAWPLPVGLNEGEAKGALGQVPIGRRARRSPAPGPAALESRVDGRRLRLAARALARSPVSTREPGQLAHGGRVEDGAALGQDRDPGQGRLSSRPARPGQPGARTRARAQPISPRLPRRSAP